MSSESAALSPAMPVLRDEESATTRERGVLAVGTLSVWAHTADEIRIGEYIAVPAAVLTAVLLVRWARMRPLPRGLAAVALGLVWLLGAIPYHLVPLLQGAVVWQNVSGLLQLVGGVTVLVLGVLHLRRRQPAADDAQGR